MNIEKLAEDAVAALLSKQPVRVVHEANWERNGFPLPIKRQPPQADGTTVQDYRPLAIFEYIQDVVGGTIKIEPTGD